jgi:hypothetical protein
MTRTKPQDKDMGKSQTLYRWASRILPWGAALSFATAGASAQEAPAHHHGGSHGKSPDLGTSAAIDKSGRIWAVSKQTTEAGQFVVLQSSNDMGKTWSEPRRVQRRPEPVAANGEARPHIAFGNKGEIFVSYSMTVKFPHIGDIRFVRSLDGGKTFSEPATVHADRTVTAHSFESMVVDGAGRIFIAWIDGRDATAAKAAHASYAGSALYYAVSSDSGASFQGDYKVADHSCECCRIALAINPHGKPTAMWRHVFAPNIRDHALAQLGMAGKVTPLQRVTFDDWRIDACPHHGPSLAYAPDGTRHQVWFNGKDGDGGGALYAQYAPDGKPAKPVNLGSAQASHPDVAVVGRRVAVVWKQFDGTATAIMARVSNDGGASWHELELARTMADSDQPHLLASPSSILLLWRTQDQGIRIIPVDKEGT